MLNINKYHIRFFQVGSGSKGGDAILIRLFDDKDKEYLILIDAGYRATSESIVK